MADLTDDQSSLAEIDIESLGIADPHDPFECNAGPFLAKRSEQGIHNPVVLKLEAKHCNTSGTAHGGLLMTMADLAICAAACHGLPDERAITVSLTSDFVSAAFAGDTVIAEADVVRRGGSICFVRCQIRTGDKIVLNCTAVTKRVRRG